jgi:Tetracyclin repressor-like, C-terminal domain
MEIGSIREQPARPLAHALIGALDEVAMLVARSDDPEATRAEVGATLTGMLEGLRGGVREDEAETGRR